MIGCRPTCPTRRPCRAEAPQSDIRRIERSHANRVGGRHAAEPPTRQQPKQCSARHPSNLLGRGLLVDDAYVEVGDEHDDAGSLVFVAETRGVALDAMASDELIARDRDTP